MSEAAKGDNLEAEVAKLLPCRNAYWRTGCNEFGDDEHGTKCPARWRSEVTAWARNKLAALRQENHELRNKLQDAMGERQLAEAEIANRAHFETSLRAERDAAHVAGMREAVGMVRAYYRTTGFDLRTLSHVSDAIAAAIAAREKP